MILPQEPSRSTMPEHERLRWLGVWLPAVAVSLLFSLMWAHHLHELFDIVVHVLAMGIITGGVYLFSRYVFRIVEQKEQEVLRRNQELAALHAVGAVINESLDLNGVLSRALDKVLEVTGAQSGEIFLWEEGTEELVPRAFRGLFPEVFQARFKLNEGFPGRIAQTGKPIVVHDLPGDPRFLRRRVKEAGFHSFAGVPLRSKGKMVGVMGIFALDPRRLTSEDIELLDGLGNQIGVAIENATLYAQLREMTMLEERQRIAREMHDGLAQALSSLHFRTSRAQDLLKANETARVQATLEEIRKMAEAAYEDIRQSIFGLRTMVSRSLGLVPTLTEYLHDWSLQNGVTADLQIRDERRIRLSPEAELQLIRIIQEALANVRKHAAARYARVRFELEGDHVLVTVADDGKGFHPAQLPRSRNKGYGLETMRERAESVGGSLKVQSQPGRGTSVLVRLPLSGKGDHNGGHQGPVGG